MGRGGNDRSRPEKHVAQRLVEESIPSDALPVHCHPESTPDVEPQSSLHMTSCNFCLTSLTLHPVETNAGVVSTGCCSPPWAPLQNLHFVWARVCDVCLPSLP